MITNLSLGKLREQLEIYLSTGNYLRADVQYINDNIQKEMMRSTQCPRLFYFVEASSGMGKSQLAASLSSPVVYIPWAYSQDIYRCFDCVSNAVRDAINDDRKFLVAIGQDIESVTDLMRRFEKLSTVGLLVTLFREVYGRTNEESLRVLSGYDGERTLRYQPMSFNEAKKDLNEFITGAKNNNQNSAPIFFIDEVPSNEPKESDKYHVNYLECVLLRNIIRVINCMCVLSGTEAALMNAIDKIPSSSRTDNGDIEYVRLILKLPRTNWEAICNISKYAELIPLLPLDVCTMLKSTRPLFVQYVLSAMLEEHSMGKLTAAVLSTVKGKIIDLKTNFATSSGLFGQTALVYSKLISNTVDKLQNNNKDAIKYIEAQRRSVVRHHFGRMRVKDSYDMILSLFLARNFIYTKTGGKYCEQDKFSPNFDFEFPCNDPLLYLTCIRDGFYGTNEDDKIIRFSSSYALKELFAEKNGQGLTLLTNTVQNTCSGNFLEVEVVTAVIIASHSYSSLSGCPFDVFLASVVAELNPFQGYVKFDAIRDIPRAYEALKVGLLSPANLNWGDDNECILLQDESIVLGPCDRSANKNRNDGTFPAFIEKNAMLMGSLEVKCYQRNVPTDQLIQTIRNTSKNDCFITVMVVTKFGFIQRTNQKFKDATVEVDVAIIKGNASENLPVATELNWEHLTFKGPNMATTPKHTVILIDLESIYYDRYNCMDTLYLLK